MARTVSAFNALKNKDLSTEDGWDFMVLLKMSRSQEGQYHEDDYIDRLGYEVLAAEEAYNNNKGE